MFTHISVTYHLYCEGDKYVRLSLILALESLPLTTYLYFRKNCPILLNSSSRERVTPTHLSSPQITFQEYNVKKNITPGLAGI